ncbi:MAG: GFA family protein [Proteobacteria bacterium]|nr:GFA family protein [Pseudomonadota bacterium]
MIEAACHCGAVRLTAPSPPETVTECNCSICRRTAARWAYYSPTEVTLPKAGSTQPYVWGDKMLALHRCRTCGVTTHWQSLDGSVDRMGINTRNMEGLDWDQIRIRHLDGADTWTYLD